MDFKKSFKVVSTGQRVSSLYAEPELTVYPKTGRMRLTRKALQVIGAEVGNMITVLQSDAYLAFVEAENGRCKLDKNGNFTSAATVTPLGLDENTSFRKYETMTAGDIGLDDFEAEKPVIIFDLSESIEADSEEEDTEEESEATEE